MTELLPTIVVPADWNAQKDCEYFEERWKPLPTYTEALWHWMRFHHGFLVKTLSRSLRYVHERDATLVYIDPLCLSAGEKIEVLLKIAATSAVVAGYRRRLQDHLRICEFAERERRRVVRAHSLAGEHAWLYPVIEAIDYIGHAAFLLDETMACENDDYCQLNLYGFEEEDDQGWPFE
jgi:hypothetical protein